jgi:DNA primase
LVELKKQVKAASDIVDVVGGYVPLTPAGKVHKAVCPFHNDTRPSMQVAREHQNFRCWACGVNGDVFTFVEKFERVGFMEALTILARRAGIRTEDATPQDTHKVRLYEVMAWAQHVYQECLLDGDVAAGARKYLGERHLSGATVREFGLGFAPVEPGWLERLAARDGVPLDLLVEVGLLGRRDENRGLWDRFRDRVMFPIRDAQKRTVGFGGRILPDSPFAARGPKYYNTAETVLFKKQENIYGIDAARHAGSAAGYLAVVEGYTDVMMAHQCGVTNVVATMGTALNASHVAQLRRYAPRVVLVFDADAGGNTGVDRALDIFVSHDVELAVAALPDGLDPADLLAQPGGPDRFRAALAGAADALDFKLNQLLGDRESALTVDAARRMLDAVLGIMALAPPVPSSAAQLKQELILTRLAHRLGVELRLVRGRLRELQQERRAKAARETERAQPVMTSVARVTAPAARPTPAAGPAQALEKQLVQLVLADPGLVPAAMAAVRPDDVTHTGLRRMLVELYALHEGGAAADLDGLRVRLLDRPDLAAAAMDLHDVGRTITDPQAWFDKVLAGFARQKADAERRAVKERLSGVGDDEAAALDLLRQVQSRSAG